MKYTLPFCCDALATIFSLNSLDGFGAWSTSGCREVVQGESHTVCECNLLGHFGILFVRGHYNTQLGVLTIQGHVYI